MSLRQLFKFTVMVSGAIQTVAVPSQADGNIPQLAQRSHLSPADRSAIQDDPDLTFTFPKDGTFELIQSLTEIVALEARESQANPSPPDEGTPPGPPKKKPQYKCSCHCSILFCGCTCKTLPLPELPPGSRGHRSI